MTDGYQEIVPIAVNVKIVGTQNSDAYDTREHEASGYTALADVNEGEDELFDVDSIEFSGTAQAARTEAGKTDMGLSVDQFQAPSDPNFSSVNFQVIDGYQEILPIDVVVTVTGNVSEVVYDGQEHAVSGYEIAADVNEGDSDGHEGSEPVFDLDNVVFNGNDSAARTDAGTTYMGLSATQFTCSDADNYSSVTFDVTDGYQAVAPASANVTITGNGDEHVFDGKPHVVEGFSAVADTPLYEVEGDDCDFTFSGKSVAGRTDAGTTPMGLSADQFANTNPNFQDVVFTIEDGYMNVTPMPVTVNVQGSYDAVPFDGQEHSTSGYTLDASSELYDLGDVVFMGNAQASGSHAGMRPASMGLESSQFTNADPNFDVTFHVEDGYLFITPENKVTVLVEGNKVLAGYDGKEHVAEGYTFKASDPLYTVEDFAFSGQARVVRTDAGEASMGLSADQFQNVNPDFEEVEFVVVSDGGVCVV